MIKNNLFSVIFLFISLQAGAVIRNVPQQYPTIQSAIDAAAEGDTILVASGVYYENITFRGKGIVVASNFLTTNDTSFISATIIDGSTPAIPDSASCVRITSSDPSTYADTTAMLAGFTIRGGTGTRWEDEHNLGNWYREGGGLLIQFLSPRIRFNHFINNQAINKQFCTSAGGGAIRCGDGNPRITNNIIDHNQGRYGGGLVFNFSGAYIANNIISNNSGGEDYGGGGIWAYGQEAHGMPRIVENNTIVNNISVSGGGGIRVWSTPVTIINNIIWGNTATIGAQIYSTPGSAMVTYCDVQSGYNGNGNQNQPPQFLDSNYFLDPTSPCVDKGDSTAIYNDPANPAIPAEAKFPARGTVRNDMGAYGGPRSALLGNTGTIVTGTGEIVPGGSSLFPLKITPNPCIDQTSVSFYLESEQWITIEVGNSTGQVSYLRNKAYFDQGHHDIRLNVSQLNPGFFCLRIISENAFAISKFIKL